VTPGAFPYRGARANASAAQSQPAIEESAAVRPYALTGGRTRGNGVLLPIEALVRANHGPQLTLTGERARIVERVSGQYLSIAELSAHLRLPVGVVRVLVADLADEGLVGVAGAQSQQHNPAATLRVLESVLNGISAL
jgi:Protein of unknown function (DUF742)